MDLVGASEGVLVNRLALQDDHYMTCSKKRAWVTTEIGYCRKKGGDVDSC